MKKCAIITGASRGIGAGIAEKLASEKWNLALCARQKVEDGSKLAAALQEKYGLTETLKDLYAWEVLSADEAIGIQKYRDEMREGGEPLDLDESMLKDELAVKYYEKGFFSLGESLELQRIRMKNGVLTVKARKTWKKK